MDKQKMLDDAKEKMFLIENDFGMSNAVIPMSDLYKILTAHDEWISVEDGLPEIYGEDYSLVCFTNKYGRQEYEFAYRSNHKSTYGDWFTKKGGYAIDNITHWQPLPAPPED